MKEKALKFIKGRGYEATHSYFDNDAAGEKINEYFKENLTGLTTTPQNEQYAGFITAVEALDFYHILKPHSQKNIKWHSVILKKAIVAAVII
jgi:5S rRNA maturation endonuclease (ribonuclease M5)